MTGWRVSLWVAVLIAALGFLYLVRGILLPFIVTFIIASLLEPLVRKMRLRGFSRLFAVLSILAPAYILVAGLLVLIVPRITTEVGSLSTRVDDFTNTLMASSDNNNYFLRWNPVVEIQQSKGFEASFDRALVQLRPTLEKLSLPSSRQEIMQQYVEPRRPEIAQYVRNGFGTFFGFLGAIADKLIGVLVLIFGIPMLLLDMEELKRKGPKWIPPAIRTNTVNLLTEVGQVFIKYLRGVALVVLLYMVSAAIMLTALSVPYSLLLAVIFGTLYMIPYIGNIMVYVILFFVIGLSNLDGTFFMHFGSPWIYAAAATGMYAVMGLIFDHLLYPSLVGNAVGLDGFVSLFVIFSGGALFGLVGMIIAFPLAGAIKIILDRALRFTTVSQDSLHLPSVPIRHRRSATGA